MYRNNLVIQWNKIKKIGTGENWLMELNTKYLNSFGLLSSIKMDERIKASKEDKKKKHNKYFTSKNIKIRTHGLRVITIKWVTKLISVE